MDIEIFETENGFGYKVGSVYQEFDPELNGFIPMTRGRAEECANIIKVRLEPPIELEENIINEEQAVS